MITLSSQRTLRVVTFIAFIVAKTGHYNDVIMGAIASQITSLTIVYSTVYSDPDQRKYQSSASLAYVRGFHRWPVNSPHKWLVTRKMFPFDDVIMYTWMHHDMVTRPALQARCDGNPPVTGGYWPFVMGIHRWLVGCCHKGPVTQNFNVFCVASLNMLLNT